MKSYEEEYFKVFDVPGHQHHLKFKATADTGRRRYSFTKLNADDGPICFRSSSDSGLSFTKSDFLLHGFFPVVSKKVAKEVMSYDINGFQLFPTELVSDNGEKNEDFFFFNAYQKLDCIDFRESEIFSYSPEDCSHEVQTYKLKVEVLDAIPIEHRLIIRPEKVAGGGLLLHENIVSRIKNYVDKEKYRFFKLSEYELGDRYR